MKCLVMFAMLCCQGAQSPANLLNNPGFEDVGPSGLPTHWGSRGFDNAGGIAAIDATVAHSGRRSLRLGIKPNSFLTCSAGRIPVKPNTTYFLACWCKTQDFKRARAYVFVQTNKAQRVLADVNQYGTQDWTRHLAQYTTAADETSLAPVLTTQDTGGHEGWCWFDDVELFEGGFPEPLAGQWKTLRREAAGISETAVILAKTDDAVIWCDNLAAKIYREDGVPSYAKPVPSYEIAAARNEEALFQVSITPGRDLAGVALVPRDFTGPGKIPSSGVRWWKVGYANIKTALRPETRLGLTPDPLLDPAPVAAPKAMNTAFCVGVRVPAGAAPGSYRGVILVKAGDRLLAELPVALRVYNFTLPKDPTFRTLITYAPAALRPWDKRPLDQIEKDICRVLYGHGIRGCGASVEVAARLVDGKIVCDFQGFDDRMSLLAENLGCNAFFLGPTGVEAARSNDKNICVIEVAKVRLINNDCHDSQVEDGICCHGPVGPYMLVARNRTTGNPRFGIHLGVKSDYAIVARNVMLSNRINLYVVGAPPYGKDNNQWKQDNKGLIVIENTVGGKKTGR